MTKFLDKSVKKFFIISIVWLALILALLPDPKVSLAFNGEDFVSVQQIEEPSGHFHLYVTPKEAANRFAALTIAGLQVFPRDWLVANVASTAPLGESEIVDFPRFFDLLPKLFRIGRSILAALPLFALILFAVFRHVIPTLKRTCGRRTLIIALFSSTILSFPEPISDYTPGLDPSWNWFLNHFAFHNIFGSEVVFTYGPLGFLLCPQESWACVLCALASNVLFAFLWIRLVLKLYHRSIEGQKTAWVLIATTIIPMAMEWKWTMLAVLYAVVPLISAGDDMGKLFVEWAIAGMLAAIISLMKFSALTIVLGTQCFCLVALLLNARLNALRSIISFSVSFTTTATILSIACFSSFNSLLRWIHGSFSTASGYNLYMVAEKPWFELAVPLVIMIVFLATVGWRRCILFAPILFLTTKYAWVRQSPGPLSYVVAILSAVYISTGISKLPKVLALVFIALFLNVALALPSALSGLSDMQSISGFKPLAFYHTLFLTKSVQSSQTRSADAVTGHELPASWRSRIGSASVTFLPVDYAPAMADRTLTIKPLPSLQLYSACHPYLDNLNADFFASQTPDFVVCDINAGGCGYFINYPRMWTAILENYKCAAHNSNLALLTRRQTTRPRPATMITISNAASCFEKTRGIFLRNPVEYALLTSKSGKKARFQFVRGNQGVPYPLEWIPFDNTDVCSILCGAEGNVSSFQYDASSNDGRCF